MQYALLGRLKPSEISKCKCSPSRPTSTPSQACRFCFRTARAHCENSEPVATSYQSSRPALCMFFFSFTLHLSNVPSDVSVCTASHPRIVALFRSIRLCWRLQRVLVVFGLDHLPLINLPANDCVAHPQVLEDLPHLRPLLGINL